MKSSKRENLVSTALIIDGQPRSWDYFRTSVADFVPDPMTLRAGDLFLMGCERASSGPNSPKPARLWEALDKNIPGILGFFDLLVTRERIPLIDYRHTFSNIKLTEVLKDHVVKIKTDPEFYGEIKKDALAKLRKYKTSKMARKDLVDVMRELDAFGWEWSPELQGVKVSEERRQVAQFLLGGLIFNAYAQVSGTEHILQSKRARLFVALSAPDDVKRSWAYEREEQLFEDLRSACETEDHVRYEERPAAPSIVPYLMKKKPYPTNPQELLEKVMEFRETKAGKEYRSWWQDLHASIAIGAPDPKAKRDLGRVVAELNRRYQIVQVPASEARVSFEAGVTSPELASSLLGKVDAKAKIENLPIRVPRVEWLRRWFVERWILHPGYSKTLLRLSTANREYENLGLGLKGLWDAPGG